MKKLVCLFISIIFIFLLQNAIGQQKISLDFKAQISTSKLSLEGSELENLKPIFNQNALSAGIQYKIGKYFEIGFHVFDQKSNFKFSDNQSISLNNDEYIKLNSQSIVQVQALSGHISLLIPAKGKDKLQWLFSAGYNYGIIKPTNGSSYFSYQVPEISVAQSNIKENYRSVHFETGINMNLSKLIDFRIGCGYNYSFSPIYECNYSVQTPSYSANSNISSNGSGVYFGTSISLALIHIEKREKKPPKFSPQFNDKNEVIAIDNREVITNFEIKVASGDLEIQLWDYGKEDGDKISLFMNGSNLLKKHVLTNKRKKIKVSLNPGANKLIVYAHNLGKDTPNTASIIVNDGETKQLLSLQSTLGECGSISIIYEP